MNGKSLGGRPHTPTRTVSLFTVVLIALATGCVERAAATPPPPPPAAEQSQTADDGRWLTAHFPNTMDLRIVDDPEMAARGQLPALRGWVDGAAATVYDRACRPITVRVESDKRNNVLAGEIHTEIDITPEVKGVGWTTINFGIAIRTYDGAWASYRKSGDQWIEEGRGADGCCVKDIGGLLSRVTRDAAWWSMHIVEPVAACTTKEVAHRACDGGAITCKRCVAWDIDRMGMFSPPLPKQITAAAVSCDARCPQEEKPDAIMRAEGIIAAHRFTELDDSPPYLFRTRRACADYRRAHPFTKEQLNEY